MSDTHSIVIDGVHKSFGRNQVLRGVDLQVPAGSIFGLLGTNGQGKTTLIRILLGLLRVDRGHCRVHDIDPQQKPTEVRAMVGYMAENQAMYGWMTVGKLMNWVGRFYSTWDSAYADELRRQMHLEPKQKVGNLSKGQTSRLALLLALAHRPKTVILDDPTLGLDPIARKDFLRDVIGHLQSAGVTVLFSSHLLYEIEPICDRVAILHDGRIIHSDAVDSLRQHVKRVLLTPDEIASRQMTLFDDVPGRLDVRQHNGRYAVVVEDIEQARPMLQGLSTTDLQVQDLSLDEIFEAHVIGRREQSGE